MPLARLHSAEEWVERFGDQRKNAVVTIGNFDGMHRGHQEIIRRVVSDARRAAQIAAVLTLFPHPARVLRPTAAPAMIMTLEQRLAAFDAAGVEAALVLGFNEALSKVRAEDFARMYLVECMRARKVLVGENFRFGHRQEGDLSALEGYGQRWGFEVEIVKPVMVDGIVASSSAVREAVREGHVEAAERLLGRPFSLAGEIQPGTGQGRKLVVPTLNLKTEQELRPKIGVYATETVVEGNAYRSVTNVGIRPTFNGAGVTVESHLFDFSKNLTAGLMEVRFLARIRDERKFSGPEALREQILKDIEEAKVFHEKRVASD
jgi:riboflavin kinase / FMN adenylyltransferase